MIYICPYKPINNVTLALFKRRPRALSTNETNKTQNNVYCILDDYKATTRTVVLSLIWANQGFGRKRRSFVFLNLPLNHQ